MGLAGGIMALHEFERREKIETTCSEKEIEKINKSDERQLRRGANIVLYSTLVAMASVFAMTLYRHNGFDEPKIVDYMGYASVAGMFLGSLIADVNIIPYKKRNSLENKTDEEI